MAIVIKVLKDGKVQSAKEVKISSVGLGGQKSRATDQSGCVSFAMDPGEYNIYVSGTHVGTQYLSCRGENVFHI